MDRGPIGPHITCATIRKQRVDMQRHVETGQLVQDAHPTLLEVLMKSVLTVECAPCSVKLTKIKPHVVGSALDSRTGHLAARRARLPPPGRAEAQTQTSQASRGSNLNPNGDVAYVAWYVCEAVARGKEEHIASETRAARDCPVPTGEGGIHLRGYGYGCVSERSLRAYFLALSLALLRATAWVVLPVPSLG